MTNEKLYTKPTEEEYDEVKELTKTNCSYNTSFMNNSREK